MSQASAGTGDGSSGTKNDEHLHGVMVATGNEMGIEEEKTLLRACAKTDIFRDAKFLQPEDMMVDGIPPKKCRKKLAHNKKDWPTAWESWVKKEAPKAVNEKRSNVAQSIGLQEAKSKQPRVVSGARRSSKSLPNCCLTRAAACLLASLSARAKNCVKKPRSLEKAMTRPPR